MLRFGGGGQGMEGKGFGGWGIGRGDVKLVHTKFNTSFPLDDYAVGRFGFSVASARLI